MLFLIGFYWFSGSDRVMSGVIEGLAFRFEKICPIAVRGCLRQLFLRQLALVFQGIRA